MAGFLNFESGSPVGAIRIMPPCLFFVPSVEFVVSIRCFADLNNAVKVTSYTAQTFHDHWTN